MTRTHRRMHRLVWTVLGIAVTLGFAMALALRPAPAAPLVSASLPPAPAEARS